MSESRQWGSFYKNITASDIQILLGGIDNRNSYVRSINEHIKIFNIVKALEFGSGTGSMSLYLHGKHGNLNLCLLDFSMEALQKSKAIFYASGKNAKFTQGAIEQLPFKDESFQLAFGHTVLEHIDNYDKAFNELARVTKKGGLIITNVPNKYRPDGSLWYRKAYGVKYRTIEFSMRELENLYIDNGLEILKKFGSRFIYIDPLMLCWCLGLGNVIKKYAGIQSADSNGHAHIVESKAGGRMLVRALRNFNKVWLKVLNAADNIFNALPLPPSSYINIGIVGRKK